MDLRGAIETRTRLLCVVVMCVLSGCAEAPHELALSGPAMGSTYTVKVANAPATATPHAVRAAIEDALARIDAQMSGYREDSEIARFNAAATTEWFPVSDELAAVIAIAQSVSARSGGVFDVTVAPLVSAWGFGPEGELREPPDAAAVERLQGRVGYTKLHVRSQPPAVRKEAPDLTVDLNGVAPGYAVDAIAARLVDLGLAHFMIELGGEVRALGRNARGERWRIAVERPYVGARTPYAILQLDDAAVATSGEYRRSYVREGRRYSHTVDPRTARPVAHALAAVVVIAQDAAHADAWATAYNVLGEEAGYALATRLRMPVMFITARGDALADRRTPEFERYLTPGGRRSEGEEE